MFMTINFPRSVYVDLLSNHAPVFDFAYKNITTNSFEDLFNRIKEIVDLSFQKIKQFNFWLETRSDKINLKTAALFGCIVLVTVLVISSIFRCRNPKQNPNKAR